MKKSKVIGREYPGPLYFVSGIIFFLVVLFVAGWYRRELFFRIQELSIFLPDMDFFRENMSVPGGFLKYAGSWLTQFFYYPMLGAAFLGAVLITIQILVRKSFGISGKYFFLSFIPSVLLLVSVAQLDYVIFRQEWNEYLYSQILGFFFTALFIYLASLMVKPAGRFVFMAAILLLYPLFGFYSLLTVLLLLVAEFKKDKRMGIAMMAGAGVLLVLVPVVYYFCCYDRLSTPRIYTSGLLLKIHYRNSWTAWMPVPLTAIFLLLMAVLNPSGWKFIWNKKSRIINYTALGLYCLFVFYASSRDKGFHAVLKMHRTIQEQEWAKTVEISRTENTNRVIYLYRNLALWKQGRLCEELFDYYADIPPAVSDISMYSLMGEEICYYYGLVNESYRWAMENMVVNGVKAEHLLNMLKAAILNKEVTLAIRYYNILSETLFYKKEARKYREYIFNPEKLDECPELNVAVRFMPAKDELLQRNSSLEFFLLENFMNLEVNSFETLELAMSAVLLLKKKDYFWRFANMYKANNIPMPRAVQEASLLFLSLSGNQNPGDLDIGKATVQRYNQFVALMQSSRPGDERTLQKVRDNYGDTFWGYYFTVNDIVTN